MALSEYITPPNIARAEDALRDIANVETIRTPERTKARSFLTALGIPSLTGAQLLKTPDLTKILDDPHKHLLPCMRAAGVKAADFNNEEAAAIIERGVLAFNGLDLDGCLDPIGKRRRNVWRDLDGEAIAIDPLPDSHESPRTQEEADEEDEGTSTQPEAKHKPGAKPDLADAMTGAISDAIRQVMANAGAGEIDREELRALVQEEARRLSFPQTITVKTPDIEKTTEGTYHKDFNKFLKFVAAGVNVCLVGPAGSGKTTAAQQVAEALGLGFEFTGALTSEYKLSGFIDAQGRIVSTAFRRAYTEGKVFLFDEIDGSMPGAVLAFNAALANGHADFPDGTHERHKDFRVVAGANTYGRGADRQYVGRFQLDGATLDRFAVLDWDYDEKLERTLCSDAKWCERVQAIRAAVQKSKVRHIVSPRASIEGAKLLSAGLSQRDVEEALIWKGLDTDTRHKIEGAM